MIEFSFYTSQAPFVIIHQEFVKTDHYKCAMIATQRLEQNILVAMYTLNVEKKPLKLLKFTEEGKICDEVKEICLPVEAKEAQLENCFVYDKNNVMIVLSHSIIFLNKDL